MRLILTIPTADQNKWYILVKLRYRYYGFHEYRELKRLWKFFHRHSSCQRVVHVENDFSAKEACHLDNIGVVFWKVQPKARLGIFLPSYEAFLVWCYTFFTFTAIRLTPGTLTKVSAPTGCHILVTLSTKMEVPLMDANTPLNVELRTFIESHFKWIFMNVKIIFRPGFSVNLQNLPGLRCHWRWWLLCFSEESTSPNLNFCGCIEVHDWKGI